MGPLPRTWGCTPRSPCWASEPTIRSEPWERSGNRVGLAWRREYSCALQCDIGPRRTAVATWGRQTMVRSGTLLIGIVVQVACSGEQDTALPGRHVGSIADAGVGDVAEASHDAPSTCTPRTCLQLGASCGSAPDACGYKVECGDCPTGQTCGGAGVNVCGTGTCIAKTCTQLGASCGYVSDGCSQAIDCGACPAPLTCGGGGDLNQCGCPQKSCAQLGASCGTVPGACGVVIACGDCPTGQTCGGGGVPNQCAGSGGGGGAAGTGGAPGNGGAAGTGGAPGKGGAPGTGGSPPCTCDYGSGKCTDSCDQPCNDGDSCAVNAVCEGGECLCVTSKVCGGYNCCASASDVCCGTQCCSP